MDYFLFAFWFFLPAGLANASPVIANKIPVLNRFKTPLDFGKSFKGKRIFGDNKTWRGLLFGVFVAMVGGWMVHIVNPDVLYKLGDVPAYSLGKMLLIGGLLGFGALLGDAIESFFKRQYGVPSGDPWFPLDQIDYIFGGAIMVMPVVVLTPLGYLMLFVVWFGMHLLVAYIAYLLGLKDKPI